MLTEADVLAGIRCEQEYYSQEHKFTSCHRSNSGLLLAEKHHRACNGWVLYKLSDWTDKKLGVTDRRRALRMIRGMADRGEIELDCDRRGKPLWIRVVEQTATAAPTVGAGADDIVR